MEGNLGKIDVDDPGTSKSTITTTTSQGTSYLMQVRAGYEARKTAGKVTVLAGPDLYYSDSYTFTYSQINTKTYDSLGVLTNDTDAENETSTRINQIGVAGFAGLDFRIHPRVNISAETGVALYYEKKRTYLNQESGNDRISDDVTKGIKFAWLTPLLNLSWFF